jgi:rfaE bifunctional protein kinase chain/domain
MEKLIKEKILPFDDLVKRVEDLRGQGKVVVQSHGIFDLIHPGIIRHLNEAKKQGDILVVSVIKDKDVRKMPGRPIFPGKMRLESIASLSQVDHVCLVDNEVPFECVKKIKPDVFVKGTAYLERDQQIHGEAVKTEKETYFGRSRIYETKGFSFSSSQIINSLLDMYPEKTKTYLEEFSKKYSFNDIVNKLNSLQNMKILIIGDGIIDEYHYCASMGKSAKAHLVVNKYLSHEVFAGGAFAIANHLASICGNVQLVTLLGKEDTREYFISHNLKPNVGTKFFYRSDAPSILKKRYINQYLNQKLFEINYINDDYINNDLERQVIEYLESVVSEYDIVLVSDFGHGFITNTMIKAIEDISNKVAVNTQTNGANAGYNLITKYAEPNFICLDEAEARLATQERFTDIEVVAKKIFKSLSTDHLIITLGKHGSIGLLRNNGKINRTPIFSSKVVDTVGAGDAFFAYTAPCFAKDMPLDFVSFIGNAVGALAVQIVGNKKTVEKHELLEFIHTILK